MLNINDMLRITKSYNVAFMTGTPDPPTVAWDIARQLYQIKKHQKSWIERRLWEIAKPIESDSK